MSEDFLTTPIENAPFREETLEQIHEVAERITERVRHVLPTDLLTDGGAEPSPHDQPGGCPCSAADPVPLR